MPPWPEELELPARKLRLDTLLALLVRLPHIGMSGCLWAAVDLAAGGTALAGSVSAVCGMCGCGRICFVDLALCSPT
ncbi:hypothetical protein [Nocardia sp. NPDC004123]